jgi:hypothetical protein
MARPAIASVVALLVVLVVTGCGGSGGGKQEAANPQAAAACKGSPLSGTPKLPSSFPRVENVTYTKQSARGPTQVVEGYFEGSVADAHDEYLKELKTAGFKILFEELEEHDSEVSWNGEGRSGQVALREDCGSSDKIYVHITNRPA